MGGRAIERAYPYPQRLTFDLHDLSLTVLPFDEAIASRAVFVIVSGYS